MKILFATDGGQPARAALALVLKAARRDRNEIVVLGSNESLVEAATDRLRGGGFEGGSKVFEGSPGPAVVAEIESGRYDLTILGAGNRNLLGRLLFGSVSTKVLQAARSSVLVVHRFEDDGSPVRVLVGTDGSSDAAVALEQIGGLLDPTSCLIDVLSVGEHLMPQITFPIPRVGYAVSALTPEQQKEWTAAAQATADDASSALRDAGYNVESRAVLGAPGPRLLAEAEETEADLVVVGSRGLGAIDRAITGSVSDQIVRTVPAALVARRTSAD